MESIINTTTRTNPLQLGTRIKWCKGFVPNILQHKPTHSHGQWALQIILEPTSSSAHTCTWAEVQLNIIHFSANLTLPPTLRQLHVLPNSILVISATFNKYVHAANQFRQSYDQASITFTTKRRLAPIPTPPLERDGVRQRGPSHPIWTLEQVTNADTAGHRLLRQIHLWLPTHWTRSVCCTWLASAPRTLPTRRSARPSGEAGEWCRRDPHPSIHSYTYIHRLMYRLLVLGMMCRDVIHM